MTSKTTKGWTGAIPGRAPPTGRGAIMDAVSAVDHGGAVRILAMPVSVPERIEASGPISVAA